MKRLSGKDMCRALERKGWRFARIKSSHHIYISPDGLRSVPVPVHGNKTLPIGTQRVFMRQTGLSTADL
ncbi:MAG TPA: hypothetical protein DDY78_20610 [Planctomycetales bacterium]|nr:hypothetical protein [Planctomycetales bacterium]